MKKALITGITGQDGSYLAESLLEKGYEVHGLVRRSSNPATGRIAHILPRLHLHTGDITDGLGLFSVLERINPDEIYNLAAQSYVKSSFEQPIYTAEATGLGALKLFEAVRQLRLETKIYQASSSEMFGDATILPQNEATPLSPRSPYACAKAYAHNQAINYRTAYNMFICCGILFNHESPRRPEEFVTRKITLAVARIKHKLQDELVLGNLEAKRDWGYAPDYVRAMWMMLQQDSPFDYVIATGEMYSVGYFAERAFAAVDLDWKKYVKTSVKHHRPSDVSLLCGDYGKAESVLGWTPVVKFDELVEIMVKNDMVVVQ